MRTVLAALALAASGCTIHATQTKTLTLQPHSEPVVIVGQCTGSSTDMFLVHYAEARLDLRASNGQGADTAPGAAKPAAAPAPQQAQRAER
jgi:hypothetical protein